MAGATGLEPAASCVTGRGSNQLNSDLVDGQRLISSAILYLLGMSSKRGGNISLHRFLRLFISFKFIIFHVGNPLDFLGRYRF
jgi:hypothetical protein